MVEFPEGFVWGRQRRAPRQKVTFINSIRMFSIIGSQRSRNNSMPVLDQIRRRIFIMIMIMTLHLWRRRGSRFADINPMDTAN